MYLCCMDMLGCVLVLGGLVWFFIWAMTCPTPKPAVRSAPSILQPSIKVEPDQPIIPDTEPVEECIWVTLQRISNENRAAIKEKKRLQQGKPEWFICDWVKSLKVSHAEQLIIDQLSRYRIRWYREVSFKQLPLTPKGSTYRYDFYLPDHNIIIEYQGKDWHLSPERLSADNVKAEFCKQHNITLITWSGEHYYHIDHHVRLLMNKIGVRLLPQ